MLRAKPEVLQKKSSWKVMARGDDQLWKGILEDLFDDFLRFIHADTDSIFDFDREIEV